MEPTKKRQILNLVEQILELEERPGDVKINAVPNGLEVVFGDGTGMILEKKCPEWIKYKYGKVGWCFELSCDLCPSSEECDGDCLYIFGEKESLQEWFGCNGWTYACTVPN